MKKPRKGICSLCDKKRKPHNLLWARWGVHTQKVCRKCRPHLFTIGESVRKFGWRKPE